MNKPDILPMLPGQPVISGQTIPAPQALVPQVLPANAVRKRAPIVPTRPAVQADTLAYVDPYLFETGYYASPAEYEALTRTAASRIRLRADVENVRVKRRF